MVFNKISLFLLVLFCPIVLLAQSNNNEKNNFSVSPAFELLRSTHSNFFYSPSIKANYEFENGLEPGIGIEYATTPIHHDNGFVLYKLKFLPVMATLSIILKANEKIKPYAETSLGISFNNYDIAEDPTPNNKSKVSEQGFFVYTGFGAKYSLTPKLKTFLSIGFKGYKMSTNDLDINPHGLSFMLGFSFY